jgi:hypothetical protein
MDQRADTGVFQHPRPPTPENSGQTWQPVAEVRETKL